MEVTAKPASTVVLLDAMSRVYLTKRPRTMKVLSGYYVFPGGAVDQRDYERENEDMTNGKREESFDQAYYVAAARELFEEVGVLLCKNKRGAAVQFTEEKAIMYRLKLLNKELSFFQMVKKEGLSLDYEALIYFGHLTTPKKSPVRYDTRFFLAQLPKDQSPKPDVYEIEKADWYYPEEAISACQSGKISLASPTVLALKTIQNYLNGSPLIMHAI